MLISPLVRIGSPDFRAQAGPAPITIPTVSDIQMSDEDQGYQVSWLSVSIPSQDRVSERVSTQCSLIPQKVQPLRSRDRHPVRVYSCRLLFAVMVQGKGDR
jgi:hypothetical protein